MVVVDLKPALIIGTSISSWRVNWHGYARLKLIMVVQDRFEISDKSSSEVTEKFAVISV